VSGDRPVLEDHGAPIHSDAWYEVGDEPDDAAGYDPSPWCPDHVMASLRMLHRQLAGRSPGTAPIVLVIDECQELLSHPVHGAEARELFAAIMWRGRAAGVTAPASRPGPVAAAPDPRPAGPAAPFIPPAATALTLTAAELVTVLDALADGSEYRTNLGCSYCLDCSQHPAELCEDHAADLDAAGRYDALAARLADAGDGAR
jgi:hypothetical protein